MFNIGIFYWSDVALEGCVQGRNLEPFAHLGNGSP